MSYATTAEQRVRELRRAYIEIAVEFLLAGDPAGCLAAMTDGLHAQARVAGLRGVLP